MDNEKSDVRMGGSRQARRQSSGQPRHPPSLKANWDADMVLPMAEPHTHGGDMTDNTRCLPARPDNALAIRALEVRPGNRTVSHHAILGLDVTGTAANLDAQDPDPGYESFGGFGFSAESNFFGAWVPGALTLEYPPGIGRVVPAG